MTLTEMPPAVATADAAPYVAPRIVLTARPRTLTTFDGFLVSGRVHGSEVEGAEVEVSVAGVVRHGRVQDGTWTVRFEDGALSLRHAGVRPITGRVTDTWFNTAQATEWVTIDEFEDGYVYVDDRRTVVDDHLVASGELCLGSHVRGRELVVVLVRDDAEGIVMSTGSVEPGWRDGEWYANVPLTGVTAGSYRLRALLTDSACPSLTRMTASLPFTLG